MKAKFKKLTKNSMPHGSISEYSAALRHSVQPYLTLRFSLNFKHELMYFLTCHRKQITMVNLKASVPTSYPC